MRALLAALTLLAISLTATGVRAGTAEEIRATYEAFAAAQNAHDLKRVGALLLDSPRFLWVSDGMSVWGREAMLERMLPSRGGGLARRAGPSARRARAG